LWQCEALSIAGAAALSIEGERASRDVFSGFQTAVTIIANAAGVTVPSTDVAAVDREVKNVNARLKVKHGAMFV
jgi:hypothetical protein